VYVVWGRADSFGDIDLNSSYALSDAATIRISADCELGYSLAIAKISLHDNYAEVIIGAPGYNSAAGRVFVLSGSTVTGDVDLDSFTAGFGTGSEMLGYGPGDRLGQGVAVLGDLNGDGGAELLVMQVGDDAYTGRVGAGAAFVFLSPSYGWSLPASNFRYWGYSILGPGSNADSQPSKFLAVAGVGDQNSDGINDFALSYEMQGGAYEGLYVVYGTYDEWPNLGTQADLKSLTSSRGYHVPGMV
jgi:hypothetical protein